ncbi:MAG TPA: DPP IV N-terminal domain-containing protein, partial [Pyrinomonadaceae bacterium]|nr:DPP IV N-terminal domain-containing protein [Pyrinomonadaceae bacterium]
MKMVLTIAAVFFFIGELSAQKHTITPADVLSIRELDEVKVSPNGKQIVFVVNEPNDPKKPREPRSSNVWVVPVDGHEPPQPLIAGLKNASTPRWSPDGRTLAFLSDQIYLLREEERKAVRLSNVPGGIDQYAWSPDGKTIAFLARDPATAEEEARKAAGDDAVVRSESNRKYSRLWTVNLTDGKTTQVTKQDFEILEFAWSPTGNELALIVAPTPRDEDSYNLSLVIVNRSTGEVTRTLTKNVVPITGA